MKVELEIKEILSGEGSSKDKVRKIREFMNWDEKKLTDAIARYGTSKEGRDAVIKELWKDLKA